MPSIRNLNLEIIRRQTTSDVIVTYQICYSLKEIMLKTKMWERVALYAQDERSVFLANLRERPISTLDIDDRRCEDPQRIEQTFSNQLLNEDDRWRNRIDEIFVKIDLTVPEPETISIRSNSIRGLG